MAASGAIRRSIAIIGGGNSAHVLANTFSRNNVGVTVITRRPSEWNPNGIKLTYGNNPSTKKNFDGKPYTVTSDLAAASEADMIYLCCPVSAESAILTQLQPHVQPQALVGTVFGQARFDKRVEFIMGSQPCFAFIQIPWICRAPSYGEHVENYGNQNVDLAAANTSDPALQEMLEWSCGIVHSDEGKTIRSVTFREATLFPSNMILHPGICYGRHLIDSKDPYFYRALQPICGASIEQLDAERLAIIKELNARLRAGGERTDLIDENSVIAMWNELWDCRGTNMCECITADASLMDIQAGADIHRRGEHRFFQDDIPYGLAYMKLLALSVGVETPFVDRVILWAQEVMGEKFVDGETGQLVLENLPDYFRGDVSV